MWLLLVVLVLAIVVAVLYRPKATGPEKPKAEVPETNEGRKIRRVFGTVWIDDPSLLGFKLMGTIPIKSEGKK